MSARSRRHGQRQRLFGELPGDLGQRFVVAGRYVVAGSRRLARPRPRRRHRAGSACLVLGPPVGQRDGVPAVAAQRRQRVREAALEQVRQGQVECGRERGEHAVVAGRPRGLGEPVRLVKVRQRPDA